MTVFKNDTHGNPTHYECITVLGSKAEVFIEYDYSDPKRVDVHIYRMIFPEKGVEIVEPRKWKDA